MMLWSKHVDGHTMISGWDDLGKVGIPWPDITPYFYCSFTGPHELMQPWPVAFWCLSNSNVPPHTHTDLKPFSRLTVHFNLTAPARDHSRDAEQLMETMKHGGLAKLHNMPPRYCKTTLQPACKRTWAAALLLAEKEPPWAPGSNHDWRMNRLIHPEEGKKSWSNHCHLKCGATWWDPTEFTVPAAARCILKSCQDKLTCCQS